MSAEKPPQKASSSVNSVTGKPAAESPPSTVISAAEVLKTLGAADAKEPELLQKYLEEVHPRLRLPEMSREVIQEFASPDVTAERVAEKIRANPYYEAQFLQHIASVSKREELPELSAAIVLLGMQNSRNLILALQLNRTVRGSHPEWSKEGKLVLAPKETLKFALKTEEAIAGNRDAYPDTAYAAGMLYDTFTAIAQTVAPDNKALSGFIEGVFNHGLRAAKIGLELSKRMPEMVLKKYAFSACLIHDVGKIPLAILDARYPVFIEEAQKLQLPRAIRMFCEEKQFTMTHAMMGELVCIQYSIFRSISRAMLFHHQPYSLREASKPLHQLASLVSLSTNIASSFKKIDSPDDPLIAKWKGVELGDFKIDPGTIVAALANVV